MDVRLLNYDKMKKTICTLLACSLTFLSLAQTQPTIQVHSAAPFQRQELLRIPYKKFSHHFGLKDTVFSIVDQVSGNVLPHQLEKLGTKDIKHVLVAVTILKDQAVRLQVLAHASPIIQPKTYARYVPERYDDFAWENDLVAFRLYGKALAGKRDDAQGMDFWAKRSTDLVINDWYKTGDYHADHGKGLDYYSVGQTLGAGDIACYYNQQIQYTQHYSSFEILDNGPLRTSFKLTYDSETLAGRDIKLTKIITLDAGSQFNRIEVNLKNADSKNTPVVIGLARRGESNPEVAFDQQAQSLTYWEPAIASHGHTGTALILPKHKATFIQEDPKQFLIASNTKNNRSFVYYTGAAWNKAGKITSFEEWKYAVQQQVAQLNYPLTLTYH